MIMSVATAWIDAANVLTGSFIRFNEISLLANGMTPTFLEDT
jgi:hypothetical protein